MGQTLGQRVSIVTQRPGCTEIPWVRFLLGDLAGEVVEDPERRLVQPDSLVVCDRLDALGNRTLNAVRRVGTVGLLHIADRRYRCRLDAYSAFGWVWRTYYHSGLVDLGVRQLPLGPAALGEVTDRPSSWALRSPVERLYTWSYMGPALDTRREMVAAFRSIEGGMAQVDGEADWSSGLAVDPTALIESLADTVFAPCGAENGHLESARVYEALEMGAIPVVERRRRFDYFRELFGDHPLPTVRSWSDAPALVRGLLADQDALGRLQRQVVEWWTNTKRSLAEAARADVTECLGAMLTGSERNGTPLDRPAPRWRGRVEMLRHRPPRWSRARAR